ncbi:unnamed protein product [Adineta steineri]|uniref:SARAH domain-containing protein n=1 Tax=Adineta steineri TaxID=433720 RepID=A0A818J594_9BILA|nr:unnamed protein product [Adineta steineri]
MSKKKQVTFQSNIPGKFIPRDDPPAASVFRFGSNGNRFNSRMAELLASSSLSTTVNNENESIPNARISFQDNPISSSVSPEVTTNDSTPVHSRLIHRRIATMLDTLKGRGSNSGSTSPPSTPKSIPTNIESKTQPITFGQLRQATTSSALSPPPSSSSSSSTVVEEIPSSKVLSTNTSPDFLSINTSDKQPHHTNVTLLKTDNRSDLMPISSTPIANKLPSKHQSNKARLHYSASLEKLLEQHNVVPQMKQDNELTQEDQQQQQEQSKPPLTVDEILATHYSKIKIPTTTELQTSTSLQQHSYPNNSLGFHLQPSSSGWNPSQINQRVTPIPHQLKLTEQNKNRPPPPSYSFSMSNGHRPPAPTNNLVQHLIRHPVPSPIREYDYSASQLAQHLLPVNSSVISASSSSSSVTTNTSIRTPSPRYELPTTTTNIERSHSALSSMNRSNYSQTNPSHAGFDREFSRLLYGKDGGKKSHQRQKRKSLSDPVKKSVEEAGRSVEKTHRRLTNHLHKNDIVREEEETSSDSNEIDKQSRSLFPQRHFQRQSDLIVNNREFAKKPIVPPNPFITKPIPQFLTVYSQASSSNDILLQWQLFSLSDLESFDAMMTRLYKDENLLRVKLYEMYRTLLTSALISKKSSNKIDLKNNINDDDDSITTTAL